VRLAAPGGRRRGRARTIAAAALLAAAAATDAGAGATDIAAVDRFIDAPRALFGRTRADIERALGPPTTVRTAEPGGPAGRAAGELAYPGLLIRVHATSALAGLVITAPGFRLPQGLGVGAPRTRVETALGEPTAQSDTRAMYLYADGYPDTVEFHFRDGRVSRIEWRYGSTTPAR
jgi:hypothetical protein